MSEMGTAMMGTGSASGPDRAQEAAEAAIASPLLEDIDLAGAKGILVNITAGMDISIEEFETVGNTVKAFASENATVVVGAVIDMEMQDELRVTVVATGIGGEKRADISLVQPAPMAATGTMGAPAAQPAMRPAAQAAPEQQVLTEQEEQKSEEGDYFDIPAFLRKQAE
jgi:cell division protein FtsZ